MESEKGRAVEGGDKTKDGRDLSRRNLATDFHQTYLKQDTSACKW